MTTTAHENGHTEPVPTDNITSALAVPSNALAQQWRVAQLLVRSHYFQDAQEAPQAFTKILAGAELGFGPIASMQGVYIVKGRVTLAANLVAAAIQKSGRFRYRVTRLDNTGCTIKFFERWDQGAWNEVGESTFTAEDAAAAGLSKSDTYSKFPRNMFFARALTNGARWHTPELFNGPIYTPDEMGATVDDDGRVINIPAAPPMDTDDVQRGAQDYDRIVGTEQQRDQDGAPFVPFNERDADDAPRSSRSSKTEQAHAF